MCAKFLYAICSHLEYQQLNIDVTTIMVDNQDKFVSELLEMSSYNKSSNNALFTRNKYTKLLQDVKQATENTDIIGKDRNLLKQYDVLKVANVEKLIRKKTYDGKQ